MYQSGRDQSGRDLAKLTLRDKDRSRSVSPGPHPLRSESYVGDVLITVDDDDSYPALTIVPTVTTPTVTTPLGRQYSSLEEDESEREGMDCSMDLPLSEPFTVDSPLPLILQALTNKCVYFKMLTQ